MGGRRGQRALGGGVRAAVQDEDDGVLVVPDAGLGRQGRDAGAHGLLLVPRRDDHHGSHAGGGSCAAMRSDPRS